MEQVGFVNVTTVAPIGVIADSVALLAGCKNDATLPTCCFSGHAARTGAVCPASLYPSLAVPAGMIDVELWRYNKQVELSEWVESAGLVESAGSAGVRARSGLYVDTRTADALFRDEGRILDHYRAFKMRSVLARFEAPLSNATINRMATAFPGHCGSASRALDQGCVGGWFHPPPCDPARGGDPSQCATLFAEVPEYDATVLPRLVRNLPLNVSVVWLGPAFEAVVRDRMTHGRPVFFSSWIPNRLQTEIAATRVALPDSPTNCYADQMSNYGPGACDFPEADAAKMYWNELATHAPGAVSFLRRFSVSSLHIEALFRRLNAGASIETAACEWVRANNATWHAWLPAPPACTAEHFTFSVRECAADFSARRVTFRWRRPNPTNPALSRECVGGVSLPDSYDLPCKGVPPNDGLILFVSALNIVHLVLAVALLLAVVAGPAWAAAGAAAPAGRPRPRCARARKHAAYIFRRVPDAQRAVFAALLLAAALASASFSGLYSDDPCVPLLSFMLFAIIVAAAALLAGVVAERYAFVRNVERQCSTNARIAARMSSGARSFESRAAAAALRSSPTPTPRSGGSSGSAGGGGGAGGGHQDPPAGERRTNGASGSRRRPDARNLDGRVPRHTRDGAASAASAASSQRRPAALDLGSDAAGTQGETPKVLANGLSGHPTPPLPLSPETRRAASRRAPQADDATGGRSSRASKRGGGGGGGGRRTPGTGRWSPEGPPGSEYSTGGEDETGSGSGSGDAVLVLRELGILDRDVSAASVLSLRRREQVTWAGVGVLAIYFVAVSCALAVLAPFGTLVVSRAHADGVSVDYYTCTGNRPVAVRRGFYFSMGVVLMYASLLALRLRLSKHARYIARATHAFTILSTVAYLVGTSISDIGLLRPQIFWTQILVLAVSPTTLYFALEPLRRPLGRILFGGGKARPAASGDVHRSWIDSRDVSLGAPIGWGGSGTVYEATYQHVRVAVKRLHGEMSQAQIAVFSNELRILSSLRHPNVVTLYGFCPFPPLLVMEFLANGSLHDLLHNSDLDLPLPLRLRILLDAARGVAYLHRRGIVHGDVKSPNLLLDDAWRCKVSDLGTGSGASRRRRKRHPRDGPTSVDGSILEESTPSSRSQPPGHPLHHSFSEDRHRSAALHDDDLSSVAFTEDPAAASTTGAGARPVSGPAARRGTSWFARLRRRASSDHNASSASAGVAPAHRSGGQESGSGGGGGTHSSAQQSGATLRGQHSAPATGSRGRGGHAQRRDGSGPLPVSGSSRTDVSSAHDGGAGHGHGSGGGSGSSGTGGEDASATSGGGAAATGGGRRAQRRRGGGGGGGAGHLYRGESRRSSLARSEVSQSSGDGGDGVAAVSPLWASPEAVLRGEVTTASDVYSLGVVLAEVLAQAPPFEGVDLAAIPLFLDRGVSAVHHFARRARDGMSAQSAHGGGGGGGADGQESAGAETSPDTVPPDAGADLILRGASEGQDAGPRRRETADRKALELAVQRWVPAGLDKTAARRLVRLARKCTRSKPAQRPTIGDVVAAIEAEGAAIFRSPTWFEDLMALPRGGAESVVTHSTTAASAGASGFDTSVTPVNGASAATPSTVAETASGGGGGGRDAASVRGRPGRRDPAQRRPLGAARRTRGGGVGDARGVTPAAGERSVSAPTHGDAGAGTAAGAGAAGGTVRVSHVGHAGEDYASEPSVYGADWEDASASSGDDAAGSGSIACEYPASDSGASGRHGDAETAAVAGAAPSAITGSVGEQGESSLRHSSADSYSAATPLTGSVSASTATAAGTAAGTGTTRAGAGAGAADKAPAARGPGRPVAGPLSRRGSRDDKAARRVRLQDAAGPSADAPDVPRPSARAGDGPDSFPLSHEHGSFSGNEGDDGRSTVASTSVADVSGVRVMPTRPATGGATTPSATAADGTGSVGATLGAAVLRGAAVQSAGARDSGDGGNGAGGRGGRGNAAARDWERAAHASTDGGDSSAEWRRVGHDSDGGSGKRGTAESVGLGSGLSSVDGRRGDAALGTPAGDDTGSECGREPAAVEHLDVQDGHGDDIRNALKACGVRVVPSPEGSSAEEQKEAAASYGTGGDGDSELGGQRRDGADSPRSVSNHGRATGRQSVAPERMAAGMAQYEPGPASMVDPAPSHVASASRTSAGAAAGATLHGTPVSGATGTPASFQPPEPGTSRHGAFSPRISPTISVTRRSPPTAADAAGFTSDDFEIPASALAVGPRVGKGSYAAVFEGIYAGTHVAVKQLHQKLHQKHGGAKVRETFMKETNLMLRTRHPNLVLLLGRVTKGDQLMMVTELLERGSLFDVYHSEAREPDLRIHVLRCLHASADVARGMAYLHSRSPPIVHRDLKSPNVMVDEKWTCKVGDFGLSRVRSSSRTMTKVGSPLWAAPEVLRGERFDEKCDQYSFTVVVNELLTWAEPFVGMSSIDVMRGVAFKGLRPTLPDWTPPTLQAVLKACWSDDFQSRPPFEQVLNYLEDMQRRLTAAPDFNAFLTADDSFIAARRAAAQQYG